MPVLRETRSLFGEILDWMLAPLLLLWPMSVFLIWLVAQGIAHLPFDRELGELARALSRQVLVTPNAAGTRSVVRLKLPELATDLLRADDVDQVFVQVLGARGEHIVGDRDLPVPEQTAGEPLTLYFRDEVMAGQPVRVAYLWLPARLAAGEQAPLVQVAETLTKRSRLADEIVKGVVFPQFVILPLAVLLVWFALSRGIAPLGALQRRIRRRRSEDLSPIPLRDVPEEVAPLVGAINDLLSRLDASMTAQKRFLADAAHQLKTPLAGLRMQAELAQREIDAGEKDPRSLKQSLHQIELSSQRAAHMVNQLLAMARAENAAAAQAPQTVPLAELARETVRDFVPRAMERRIDLGYEGPTAGETATRLIGQPMLVRELLRNLVDNALLYTPSGGAVTVRIVDDRYGHVVALQVEDNGPGIPQAERARVFEPFYRSLGTNVDGSGLGLAIVREIAQAHGAEVWVEDARADVGSGPSGALFTVRFPGVASGSGPD
ncbi:MAG: sensor histidine kinase N-terminal domain-containing protein [Aquabacterium sp.]